MMSMRKRQKFVISSLVLSLCFVLIGAFNLPWRYQAIGIMAFFSVLLSVWCLWEKLKWMEWLMILILPPLYTASIGIFYFLLPSGWLTQITVAAGFGVGMYALLLTQNIYTVASIRTIQLFRSAQAVGFLLTLTTSFFVYNAVLSLRLPFWSNGLLVGVLSFPLVFQGLWSVKLEEKITSGLFYFSLVLSFVLGQLGAAVSFWPAELSTGSLFLTACLYVFMGLNQHYLDGRFYRSTIREYISVGMVVIMTMLLTTSWSG